MSKRLLIEETRWYLAFQDGSSSIIRWHSVDYNTEAEAIAALKKIPRDLRRGIHITSHVTIKDTFLTMTKFKPLPKGRLWTSQMTKGLARDLHDISNVAVGELSKSSSCKQKVRAIEDEIRKATSDLELVKLIRCWSVLISSMVRNEDHSLSMAAEDVLVHLLDDTIPQIKHLLSHNKSRRVK